MIDDIIDIPKALVSLRPKAQWRLSGDVLKWDDKVQTEPTKSEIDAEVIRLQAEFDALEFSRNRAKSYPSIADVTVALAEKAEGNSQMWDTITAERLAVKAKFAKP